ncbi:MAG TPA: hypothetical protein VII63_08560 [Caulobacteraceae bacterium]
MPLIIPAVIGAAGIVGGSLISAGAANNAANIAQQTAAQNNALESQIYASNKAEIQPFVDRGNTAGDELNGFLGLGGDPAATQAAFNAYLNSTGYQFNYNQGLDAVNSNAASKGLLDSGAAVKALDAYGTGLAQQYGQQYATDLAGVSKQGSDSASALAGVGQNYANAFSSNNNNAASITANAGLSSANAITGMIGQGLSAYGLSRGQSSFGGANAGATPYNPFAPGTGT